jgi:hypothetical protein
MNTRYAKPHRNLPRVLHVRWRQRVPQYLVRVVHYLPVSGCGWSVAHHPLAVSLVRLVSGSILICFDGNSVGWGLILLRNKLPSESESVRIVLLLLLLLVLLHNVRIV